ncbi:MAG TPA: nucleotide exchange factor GrpE [Myxococcota bacterium]|jgi:molecular chaperone GrpE|nr:nucleotide exchange factor GrpE [Myxococcota bacterium]
MSETPTKPEGGGARGGDGGGGGENAAPTKASPPPIRVVDRRHWASDAEGGDAGAGRAEYPNFVEQLRAQLAEKEQVIKDLMAGKEGARKKAAATLAESGREQANQELAEKKMEMIKGLLAALDNLQQCILMTDPRVSGGGLDVRVLIEGMIRTYEALMGGLGKLGLKRIETRGQPFDPALHQAVETQPSPDPRLAGLVLAEVRTGFTMEGKIVRQAQVIVGGR